MRRQPGHLRSPSQTDFYPQHAPHREAPYILALSSPSLPRACKAWSQQLQQDKVEDVERRQRQQKHVQIAQQERDRLEARCQKERGNLEKARKLEKFQTWKRMQVDKTKRETRWTQKTEAHPFHVDLWAEDEQLYGQNRLSDTQTRFRERETEKAASKDQADRRKAKVAEVDQLDILRKEKKKLQEDQKHLKARLDLDKVEQRCAGAQHKADMRFEAHQSKLADMGHLDRSHSDFFTEPRLNSSQIDKKRQWVKRMQETSSTRISDSPSGPRSTLQTSPSEERWWPTKELDQFMLADSEPVLGNLSASQTLASPLSQPVSSVETAPPSEDR